MQATRNTDFFLGKNDIHTLRLTPPQKKKHIRYTPLLITALSMGEHASTGLI